jgi:hypothetical protein
MREIFLHLGEDHEITVDVIEILNVIQLEKLIESRHLLQRLSQIHHGL